MSSRGNAIPKKVEKPDIGAGPAGDEPDQRKDEPDGIRRDLEDFRHATDVWSGVQKEFIKKFAEPDERERIVDLGPVSVRRVLQRGEDGYREGRDGGPGQGDMNTPWLDHPPANGTGLDHDAGLEDDGGDPTGNHRQPGTDRSDRCEDERRPNERPVPFSRRPRAAFCLLGGRDREDVAEQGERDKEDEQRIGARFLPIRDLVRSERIQDHHDHRADAASRPPGDEDEDGTG